MSNFNKLPSGTKIVLIIQCIAMLMGASTHISWAFNNGFLSAQYHAPFPTMLFWDSLTFIDPFAALLLLIRPKTGVIMTLLIICIDVIHNNLFYFDELYLQSRSIGDWLQTYWMILGQIVFAAFVILTFKRNLKAINNAHEHI